MIVITNATSGLHKPAAATHTHTHVAASTTACLSCAVRPTPRATTLTRCTNPLRGSRAGRARSICLGGLLIHLLQPAKVRDPSQRSHPRSTSDYNDNFKEKGYRRQVGYSEYGVDIEHGRRRSNHGERYGMRPKTNLAPKVFTRPLRNHCHNWIDCYYSIHQAKNPQTSKDWAGMG